MGKLNFGLSLKLFEQKVVLIIAGRVCWKLSKGMRTAWYTNTCFFSILFSRLWEGFFGEHHGILKCNIRTPPNHVATDNAEVLAAGSRSKITRITMEALPSNSSEFNILDLGFLAGIQSLQ